MRWEARIRRLEEKIKDNQKREAPAWMVELAKTDDFFAWLTEVYNHPPSQKRFEDFIVPIREAGFWYK